MAAMSPCSCRLLKTTSESGKEESGDLDRLMLEFLFYRFTSNADSHSSLGFQLRYETVEESQWSYSSGACGGAFTTPYGHITSPSYPENYPNHADCLYTISQPTGTNITIKILSMDIEHYEEYYDYISEYIDYYDLEDQLHQIGGVTCLNDYLEIRDGSSGDAPLIDGYCGDHEVLSFPLTIQSTQNNVWIT